MNDNQKKLFDLARTAQQRSHAPYSNAFIGAALFTKDGKTWSGCNIENASYGGTVCAERVAMWKAVSEGATMPVTEILVVSSKPEAWPPCGLCRQVLAEFATPETLVHVSNPQGQMKTFTFKELLPEAFTPAFLKG